MSVIKIDMLKKYYGKHVGVEDVSFSVNEGEIFGFVGPNGAGKSTTIKTLMGFIFPNGGSASVCGLDATRDTKEIKVFTGYVPSDVCLYENMRVSELLRRNSGFYDKDCMPETERLCELFEVDVNKHFHELSTGNKKKVSIVCALAQKPKLIILDEPTSGLDPVMQRALFAELKLQTVSGVTVFLSSHNLAEVQEYCDRVAFIKNGKILAVTDLKEVNRRSKLITIIGGGAEIPDGLELIRQEGAKRVFRCEHGNGQLLSLLSALSPDDFTVENESMEEYFWDLYGKEEQ